MRSCFSALSAEPCFSGLFCEQFSLDYRLVEQIKFFLVFLAYSYSPVASGSTTNFDNVMTKFIINKRTDA